MQLLLAFVPAFQSSDLHSNFLYNLAISVGNFSLVLLLFRDFLFRSLIPPLVMLVAAFFGLLATMGLNNLMSVIVSLIASSMSVEMGNVNQSSINSLIANYPFPVGFMVVVMTPVVEEVLFRGTLFGPLSKKNLFLAYAVSMGTFSAMHLISSIGVYPAIVIFLDFLEYLPAGFVLCFCYKRFGSIWAPIALHGLLNLIPVLLSQ